MVFPMERSFETDEETERECIEKLGLSADSRSDSFVFCSSGTHEYDEPAVGTVSEYFQVHVSGTEVIDREDVTCFG